MRQALALKPGLEVNQQTLQWVPLRMIVSRQSSMGSLTLLEKLELSYQQLADKGHDLTLPEI